MVRPHRHDNFLNANKKKNVRKKHFLPTSHTYNPIHRSPSTFILSSKPTKALKSPAPMSQMSPINCPNQPMRPEISPMRCAPLLRLPSTDTILSRHIPSLKTYCIQSRHAAPIALISPKRFIAYKKRSIMCPKNWNTSNRLFPLSHNIHGNLHFSTEFPPSKDDRVHFNHNWLNYFNYLDSQWGKI